MFVNFAFFFKYPQKKKKKQKYPLILKISKNVLTAPLWGGPFPYLTAPR